MSTTNSTKTKQKTEGTDLGGNLGQTLFITQRKNENPLPGWEELDYSVFPSCQSSLVIPFVNNRYQIGLEKGTKEYDYFERILNVQFDSPEGQQFLDNYEITLDHETTVIQNSPKGEFDLHLLKYHNGFGIIKMQDDPFDNSPTDPYLFELKDEKREQDKKYTQLRVKNEAIAALEKLNVSSKEMLTLTAEYLFEPTAGISTDIIAYNRLSDYILASDQNAARFLRAIKEDPKNVDTNVIVKRAMSRNIIRMVNRNYINVATQNVLGRNFEEVVEFLNAPENIIELGTGDPKDEPYSIKYQLKNANY
jgi:hypothetical protein